MTDGGDALFGTENFGTTYKDWQAVRIIRDNYFDVWKTFFTFYSWFCATLAGISGYIISNRPFTNVDAPVIGWLGVAFIANVLLIAVFMFFLSRRYIRNIHAILERSDDLPFFMDKLMNTRIAVFFAAAAVGGLMLLLSGWIYLMFFYYVRHT